MIFYRTCVWWCCNSTNNTHNNNTNSGTQSRYLYLINKFCNFIIFGWRCLPDFSLSALIVYFFIYIFQAVPVLNFFLIYFIQIWWNFAVLLFICFIDISPVVMVLIIQDKIKKKQQIVVVALSKIHTHRLLNFHSLTLHEIALIWYKI